MTPLQVTFRAVGCSEALLNYVKARAAKLERFSERITGCHVVVESPHRHKRHGRPYHVRIELKVPGKDLVVGGEKSGRRDQEDLYAAIDAAFEDAQRVLADHVRRARGEVKTRAA